MTVEQFDPITWVHWLCWKVRCMESGYMDFQHLFETVVERAGEKFVRIKPYGKLGDKKADGLYWADGTVFQVYAPDEIDPTKTRKKIDDDLTGAVKEWGDSLKEWVFVYNARHGLAADVPAMLQRKQKDFPGIKINPMSAADLWKIVRQLPLQDRVEILGPLPGFPVEAMQPEVILKNWGDGFFIFIQDSLSPINLEDAIRAVRPARPFAPPMFLRQHPSKMGWRETAIHQEQIVKETLERSRENLPRFAVFSLAPIPLAIHLGHLLSDRVEIMPFQYDRDRLTWAWNDKILQPDTDMQVSGLPKTHVTETCEVAIYISLSARINQEEPRATIGKVPVEICIQVPQPDVMWLNHPLQLSVFQKTFRKAVAEIREKIPNCSRVHLFYAGPTGGAIMVGQAINPRMNPPVELYEYDRRNTPRYERVLTLA